MSTLKLKAYTAFAHHY